MTRVQAVESELQKLSPKELSQVRDWLEDFMEGQRQSTDEFEADIQPSGPETAAGDSRFLKLRDEVAAGVEQVRGGILKPFDAAAVARIKALGRELLAAKR